MVALNQSIADLSESTPTMLQGLSQEQQSRLTQLLDDCLGRLENGELVDANGIKTANPDLAKVFDAYLEKLDALYGVSIGFKEPSSEPSINMTLGDFTIQREIGRGGMGVVYEANQTSLDRRVAIKLLPLASLLDARQIARFKNEAHAAGLLQHPNIVPIHSVGSERGVHYYAMQFIDGISMDAWIQNRIIGLKTASDPGFEIQSQSKDLPRRDAEQVVRWGVDIAKALHAAHENGVVHRDVKPSNLMLDNAEKIWITDFGLARCQTEASLTRSGDVIGTMRYMSPEQASGQSALIDGRADIYSLAATLYEMLTLQPAHVGDDAASILRTIDENEIVPLRAIRPDLPRDLETVIAKAMAKSREGRYETAEEFAADLTRVSNGEPTIARPPTTADQIGRFASKHRRLVMMAGLFLAFSFIGMAIYNSKLSAAKQVSDANAERAVREEKRAREAVDRLGFRMAELLSGIPAADSVRRQLLLETLDYYEYFAANVDDAPSLRTDLAVTLGKIGALQSKLGESEKAIDALKRSEALYAQLATESPSTANTLDWSTSQNNLGQALVQTGKLEDAARYFTRAIASQRKVASQHNDESATELALATTLNNLGLLLMQTGAASEAEQRFVEAIEILNHKDTHDPLAKNQLAVVRANLSGLLTSSAPDRAVNYARDALLGQVDSLEAEPGNAKLATQTIMTLNTLGNAQNAAGQSVAAIDTYHQAIDIGRQLHARWPDHPSYRRDLVLSYNHLGLALSRTGELKQAKVSFDQALELGRPLATMFASDAETQSILGGILNNLGFLHQQLGDKKAAAQAYNDAIRHQQSAVSLAPEVNRYRDYLRKHRRNHSAVTTKSSNQRRQTS